MSIQNLTAPLSLETVRSLKAGDRIRLSGVIWTGRDAAHKRLVARLDAGEPLPMPLEGEIIYFVGPCPGPPGPPVGSGRPTPPRRLPRRPGRPGGGKPLPL